MQVRQLAHAAMRCFANTSPVVISLQPLDRLLLLRYPKPTSLEATVYEPVVCLILQGRKETTLGGRTVGFGPGESLIVSHDLPVVSQVTKASPDRPYVAMIVRLDLGILRGLYDQVGHAGLNDERARSLDVRTTDSRLMDALARYLSLVDDPLAAEVLGPGLLREIHFRLLTAPHGAMLRRLLRHDSHASNVARAIEQIRRRFRESLVVPELARSVGMSSSAFHKHFKSVTETTPLQYQKELRLFEARRLLSSENYSVSSAAYEVGYESPTQFSREYARKFGVSPRRDAARVS
jgi:AraC-like DNA-binding protein